MGLAGPIQPILKTVAIADLRPTQMTVGLREVERKRRDWARRNEASAAGEFLGAHMIPAVVGPDDQLWMLDHHHLALALHLEGVDEVLVSVVARLAHLPRKRFLAFLDANNWLHPYDTRGRRREWKALPHHVGKLEDDPWRSLAGDVRRAGGYAKTTRPYAEFLWADFFRDHIGPRKLANKFDQALREALELARGHSARHLPGYAGVESD